MLLKIAYDRIFSPFQVVEIVIERLCWYVERYAWCIYDACDGGWGGGVYVDVLEAVAMEESVLSDKAD